MSSLHVAMFEDNRHFPSGKFNIISFESLTLSFEGFYRYTSDLPGSFLCTSNYVRSLWDRHDNHC